MKSCIHYYALSLSENVCRLYEGFRDELIDIQDSHFPIESSLNACSSIDSSAEDTLLSDFFCKADQHFAHYYHQDPLRLIIIGEKNNQSIFKSITAFQEIIIGSVDGNHTNATTTDLGKMTWSIVKKVLASEKALSDLHTAKNLHNVVSGIEAVGRLANSGAGATLLVEEDYHVKGQIIRTDHYLAISKEADIREINDDAVDHIVEIVLEKGGKVVFLEADSLVEFRRIALILCS